MLPHLITRRLFRILPLLVCCLGIPAAWSSAGAAAPRCGIYVTGWVAGSARLNTLIAKARGTKVNAFVIHIKDETGYVFVDVDHPLAKGTGTEKILLADLPGLVKRLHSTGIYAIGKIDCFKNRRLSENQPGTAVLSAATGDIWRDGQDMAWSDPFDRRIWELNIAVAEKIAAAGFDEVQFDYVRFPDGGDLNTCHFPHRPAGKSRSWAIETFLHTARTALEKYDVKVSADFFGITVWEDWSHTLGQHLTRSGRIVDYLYPMIYPSHFPRSFYTKENLPPRKPYKIIYHSCISGKKMLEGTGCSLRPWLQAFDYRVTAYGPWYIREQVKAAEDAGVPEWYMWNAACNYEAVWEALRTGTSPGENGK